MTEIYENIYVGSLEDYDLVKNDGDFFFVQACKEPCHRQALGYTGRSVAKTHPEYLFAYRTKRLILNMVDTETGKYFSTELFDESLKFINKNMEANGKILIHCNQGISRSPSIGLLFLATKGKIHNQNFTVAKSDFKKIYPQYQPKGIQEFLENNWKHFFTNAL